MAAEEREAPWRRRRARRSRFGWGPPGAKDVYEPHEPLPGALAYEYTRLWMNVLSCACCPLCCCGVPVDDPQTNAAHAAAAGAAALSGLFLSGVKDAAGTCPTAANFTGQAQAIAEKIFRPAPLTGIELPDCGWRTSQGGSCVLYPYDFASFNRTDMTDPMDGRYTQSESSGDGNNLCTDLLGLFSCATYSPDVGRFLTGMALANEPIAGPDYNYRTPINFRIRVCEDFCVRLFGVCAGLNTSEGGVCAGAATPTDCCTQTFAGVTVVDSTDDCWNAGGRAKPGWAALTFAVCAPLATQQVYPYHDLFTHYGCSPSSFQVCIHAATLGLALSFIHPGEEAIPFRDGNRGRAPKSRRPAPLTSPSAQTSPPRVRQQEASDREETEAERVTH